jgi:hypothetical protein
VFSIIWSFGTNVTENDGTYNMDKLSMFVKSKIVKILMSFPLDGLCFDYYVDFRYRRFKNWAELVDPYIHDPLTNFSDILVPTSDTFKYGYIL